MHLANSASLLVPVSNLSNLLAFRGSGLSLAHFGALVALPWLAAIAVEWLVLSRFFADDLRGRGRSLPREPEQGAPRLAATVLMLTLAAFVVTSLLGIDPAWAAAAGALALAVPALTARRVGATDLVRPRARPCSCSSSPSPSSSRPPTSTG